MADIGYKDDIRAHARNVPISPQKVRLVLALVRGKDARQAIEILRFVPNGAARPVSKLIASAIANADENYGLNPEDLYIHNIFANDGRTRRWRRFGARGRFKPILKRSSHVTIVLRERA